MKANCKISLLSDYLIDKFWFGEVNAMDLETNTSFFPQMAGGLLPLFYWMCHKIL